MIVRGLAFHVGLPYCPSDTLPAWSTSSRHMVFTLMCITSADDTYVPVAALGQPTSSMSHPVSLPGRSVLTGCAVKSLTSQHCEYRSSGVRLHVGRTICHLLLFVSEWTFDNCSSPGNSHWQWCRCAVAHGVAMFCCVTTASDVQCEPRVSLAGRAARYATSRRRQRNTHSTSCVPALSTSVGAQRRRQTYTLIFSVWARHTDAARPSRPRPTQSSIPPGSVNEYQLWLRRQRQAWFIPLADERGVCR